MKAAKMMMTAPVRALRLSVRRVRKHFMTRNQLRNTPLQRHIYASGIMFMGRAMMMTNKN
jgi:hypothetical protein